MPSRAPSRNENVTYFGDIGHREWKRASRQHPISRFGSEKSLSPRPSQGLKFRDKVGKVENSIRPPHSDLPLEFVKSASNRFVVQTKSSGSQQQHPQVRKGVNKEEELVKYMSKVPGYLQRGERIQDNVLNFGVLDWGRLENWTYKHKKHVMNERITKSTSGSCSSSTGFSSAAAKTDALVHSREQTNISNSNAVCSVDCGKAPNFMDQSSFNNLKDEKETFKKDTPRKRDALNSKYSKCKERYLGHGSSCEHKVVETVGRKLRNQDGIAFQCAENIEDLGFETPDQLFSCKQESIVLLLPKDFSAAGIPESRNRALLDGKSSDYNWGSFSDIFSIDEIHPDESFSDIPHSCPLNVGSETETELDLKLNTLIKVQGIEIPVHPSEMPTHSTESNLEVASTFTISEASSGPDHNAKHLSAEMSRDSPKHRRFGFGLSRMTKGLSFREGSAQPQLCSTYVTGMSGPVIPDCCTNSESRNNQKAITIGRAKASPIRRLLEPLLKSNVAYKSSEMTRMKPPAIPTHVPVNGEHTTSTIKAFLHLTVKSRLPLFKFVIEDYDEIFASTVKRLSTHEKDNMSWLYTFYSVHKIRKGSGGWRNQKVKPCRLGYNVVGQMKVSELPSWCQQKSNARQMVKESVLYNVDVSKTDTATSELKPSRELAAIVVNMPNTAGKSSSFYEDNLDDWFSDFEREKLSHTVVILPGGDHSLPHEGVPSSLIDRWRSGGSCDCGGWDVGCKLRILTDKWKQHKYLQVQCDLYDEGEAKKYRPFFSLIPLRDGLFSVEFDSQISSLQAFSISVALINSRTRVHSADTMDQFESKHEFGKAKASMAMENEGPEKHAPHPPLSPVGRV